MKSKIKGKLIKKVTAWWLLLIEYLVLKGAFKIKEHNNE